MPQSPSIPPTPQPIAGSHEPDPSLTQAPARQLPDGTSITPDGVVRSRTGAVIGKPQEKYGAYGLVKDQDGGPTPSQEERRIRGLGPGAPGEVGPGNPPADETP